jgi:putative ATP-dependent endonuclease of the OLD family
MTVGTASAPTIHRLKIDRFRSIKSFCWLPEKGVNVILGGGDVGKTSILDAIGLLLSPTNPSVVPDTDYHARNDKDGFVIEAIVSLPAETGISQQNKPSWPWDWNGTELCIPNVNHEGAVAHNHPVYQLRVRGTEDLELVYEIVQPDGNLDSLPVLLRRKIGLVRLSGDDRNDRDLRFVQGSALDRLLSDKTLRSRLANKLAETEVAKSLGESATSRLQALDEAFEKKSLPHGLSLAITGGPGLSIMALIGLTAKRDGIQLPLANWGAGTRRLSALAIAEQTQGISPITLVDEIERGLEPYRQRVLMEKLQAGSGQVFLTTHSAAAISAVTEAALWYVDHTGAIGRLVSDKIAKHQRRDPETFLARLAIVAEGATEVGFVSTLLEGSLGSPLEQHGVHVSDGGGHETTLDLLEALSDGGVRFGGFADDEAKHPTRWTKLAAKLDKLLFRWASGCLEENIINKVPDDRLEALLTDPSRKKTGSRLRSLAERLDSEDKSFAALKAKAGGALRSVMIAAALGKVPAGTPEDEEARYESHAQTWFKTGEGGRELATKVFGLGIWPTLKPQLLPFCNAVRTSLGLPDAEDIDP